MKVWGASAVADLDVPRVLQFLKHILDIVALGAEPSEGCKE